jgi:hypothetical protein
MFFADCRTNLISASVPSNFRHFFPERQAVQPQKRKAGTYGKHPPALYVD